MATGPGWRHRSCLLGDTDKVPGMEVLERRHRLSARNGGACRVTRSGCQERRCLHGDAVWVPGPSIAWGFAPWGAEREGASEAMRAAGSPRAQDVSAEATS